MAIEPTYGGDRRTLRMITIAVSAEVVWQVGSVNLSSPQSNELDAWARAPTLQKWIKLSNIESASWVTFLCIVDGSLWPAVGGGIALAGMYLKYKHAIASGLQNGQHHERGSWA